MDGLLQMGHMSMSSKVIFMTYTTLSSGGFLRGASVNAWTVYQEKLDKRDLQKIADYGIEYLKILFNLGHLVDKDFNIKEDELEKWFKTIEWAMLNDIKVTPDIALYGEKVNPHLNQKTFWLYPDIGDHMAELWGDLTIEFDSLDNIVGYHLLHVPGHKGSGDPDLWYGDITPKCIESIRNYSSKAISWMPFKMGWGDYEGIKNHTGYYDTATPLRDNNVVYTFNHYASKKTGWTGEVTHGKKPYGFDKDPLLWHLEPAINFKEKYQVPMMCCEWGIKEPMTHSATRLHWIKDMRNLFHEHDFDYAYWDLSLQSGFGGSIWSIMNPNKTWRNQIANLLKNS